MNKFFKIFLFSFFFGLLTTIRLLAQDPYYWQLTDEDGLPSMTVYQVLQDHKGLIWIATANGLCSYDGKLIHIYDGAALNDQEILKIQEAPDGKIWGVNLSGQLFFVEGGKFEVVKWIRKERLTSVNDFMWLDNRLIIANNTKNELFALGKIIIFKDGNVERSFQLYGNLIYSVAKFENNSILINVTDGFFRVLHKLSNFNKIETILKSIPISGRNITVGASEIYLQINNQLSKYDYKQKRTTTKLPLSLNPRNSIIINDYLYLFFTSGLQKISLLDNSIKTLFPNKSINGIFIDKEKNEFYSTSEGVFIVPAIENIAICNEKTTSLINLNNTIFAGNGKGDIVLLNQSLIDKKINILKDAILSINKQKDKLICSGNAGYICFDYKNLKTSSFNKRGSKVNFIDSKQRLWIGTANSCQIEINGVSNAIASFRTYAIAESPDGIIYLGSDKGIYTYDGKDVKPFEENNQQLQCRVSAMKTDAEGRLWVTTFGHGTIIIKDHKTAQVIDIKSGSLTNSFNCIYIENDIAWLGSDKGVLRYNIKTREKLWINKYYGLPSDEILSLCADNDKLLIGTSKGLVSMPFDAMKPNLVAPNLHLLHVKVNEIERNTENTSIKLDAKENNILIEYVSYQYRSHGNARYEYRITELDTNWTITDQRFLRFPNLKSGDYHFELRAINECDVRSTDTIRLFFQIAKPFWLQWWFIVGSLMLVGGVAWLISYFRFKNIQEQKELEHNYKTKFDDLRMQALQAQMNPHFIFNALNAIQHFLTINDEDNAVKFLSKFAKLIRMVFEYSKKKEITFENEIEMLQVYLSLEELRFKGKVDVKFNIAPALEQQKGSIYLPPLLIQPIIENSFKHGLFHKKTNGNLNISFELLDNKYLKCIVEDDGIGREASEKLSTWRKKQHTSSGMTSTEERIKFWHEKNNLTIKDFMKIEDLMENGEAKGTRITIIL